MPKWTKMDFIERLLPTVYADDLGGDQNKILSRKEQAALKLPEMQRIAVDLDRRPKHIRTEDVIAVGVAEANAFIAEVDKNGYWSRREAQQAKKAGLVGLYVAYELARNPSSDLDRFDMADNLGKLQILFGGRFVDGRQQDADGLPLMEVESGFFPSTPGIASEDLAAPKKLQIAFAELTGESLSKLNGQVNVSLKYRRVSSKRNNDFAYVISHRQNRRVKGMWIFTRRFEPVGYIRRV